MSPLNMYVYTKREALFMEMFEDTKCFMYVLHNSSIKPFAELV